MKFTTTIVALILLSVSTFGYADSASECNTSLALVLDKTIQKAQIQDEVIEKLFVEYPLLFRGEFFDKVLSENSSSSSSAQPIWGSILATFANGLSNDEQIEVWINRNWQWFGFDSPDELKAARETFLKIDQDPQKKEAALLLIDSNLERFRSLKKESQKNFLKPLTPGIFSVGSTVLSGAGAYLFFHNSYLGLIAGSLPYLFKSMVSFKDYINGRIAKEDLETFKPTLNLPAGKLALPTPQKVMKFEAKPWLAINDLKALKPTLDLSSLGSLEHFGTELEHGVRILSQSIGILSETQRENPLKTNLLQAIRKSNSQKNLTALEINKSVGDLIATYQQQIRLELNVSQEIQGFATAIQNLFAEHLKLLEVEKNKLNKNDSLHTALEEKEGEIEEFEKTLALFPSVLATQQGISSHTRTQLVSFMRALTAEMATSQGVASSKLRESLVALEKGLEK